MRSWGLESGAGAWAWAAAALLAAAFLAHARRSPARRGLLALRGLTAAALALALLRPALLSREGQLTKPRLLILLDAGHAMKGKAPGAASRLAQAQSWLKKHRAAIEARADASVVLVSDRARPLGGLDKLDAAAAEGTPFKPEQSLPDALPAEGPPARAWLITDGVAEGGGDLGLLLARLGAPVDVLGAGPSKRETGAAFLDLKAPDFAFLHGTIPVTATIEATGLAGREATVALSRADEGAPGGWREVGRTKRHLNGDQETFPVELSAPADALGTARMRLTAAGGGQIGRAH
ncbi:MAG: hypothetical protein PHS14_21040, partial [Elusimicrobia bacterium]|nr:hypothetical protein [Elusimicrobiota bacterium]